MVNSTGIYRCLGSDQKEYATWNMEYLANLKNLTDASRLTFNGLGKIVFGTLFDFY